ncbi:glycerol-3-phosphate dehydrogenase/oxidase [Rhodohalobacter sp. SW132]|uniref:glycerol-3-phosphate dehydrogenase/oxidase n=1 Tax=Rhodohalobacter sp. SW132 TaxID=2293433 RepID=UPI0018F73F62|nr:glycerol-3-phosphate dehydrogenase/oxidase [Rhodohalobacter sp. SW132]
MKRESVVNQIESGSAEEWDLIVIGGGATGLGVALDGVSRGFKTLVVEQADFSKGTSSRSTKLVHGGVRYLAQGNIDLVREALRERGLLQKNAPHLVQNEIFVIPNYSWWDKFFYTVGLKVYDLLSGKLSLGKSRGISKKETISRISTINSEGLKGGVIYHDGQFDDSRLTINVAQTITEKGGAVLNYCEVKGLVKQNGTVKGVEVLDHETGNSHTIHGKSVINATGVFVDEILSMDKKDHKNIVRPSQGVHLVFEKDFLPGNDAIMIPKTDDGRVLFAVPWHNKVVVGTTDTPLEKHSLEPTALEEEIEFILRTAKKYLTKSPTREDVLSVFAGLRPLAAPQGGSTKTKEISRSHKIMVSDSGLITVTGGKWTTFRKMGQDTVNEVIKIGSLPKTKSTSEDLKIHGASDNVDFQNPHYFYGTDQEKIEALIREKPELGEKLHPEYPFRKAEAVWAARNEMARTIEDFLARRIRILFLDARSAIDMAPQVAELMQNELKRDEQWKINQIKEFMKLANRYLLVRYEP